MIDIVILLVAGVFAGALNSLAGGGSFISFPALLLVGIPPILANATNNYSSCAGYIAGMVGYREELAQFKKQMPLFILASGVGGYIGAELLLRMESEQFEALIPHLMAFAMVAYIFGGKLNVAVKRAVENQNRFAVISQKMLPLLLVVLCIYGGFFGAGMGIILLSYLALAGHTKTTAMNGLKLVASTTMATVAIIRFALEDAIVWREGSVLLVGALIGGYAAARVARHIPDKILRNGIIIYGVSLTLWFYWDVFAR